MNKNDILTLTVEKMAGSMGLARHEGMTVFIKNALAGEKVTARVEKVQKNCAFLKALEILTPSPARREPPCPCYRQCGGCTLQHMDYETGLEIKREHIRDVLARIAKVDLDVPPVWGMDEPWRYRNKVILPVAKVDSRVRAGYYAPRSHRLVPVEDCLLTDQSTMPAVKAVLTWMEEYSVPPYDESSHSGLIRHIMLRRDRQGHVMLVVVSRQDIPRKEELKRAAAALPAVTSLIVNIQPQRGNVVLGLKNEVLSGEERLRDTLCGSLFDISPLSFLQVNISQAERLYRCALDFAGLQGNERVLDLYCGAGTISLLMAKHCREVVGIEAVEAAVRDAGSNARLNEVKNARFFAGNTEDVLPGLIQREGAFDAAVLDPPRKGCDIKVLDALAAAGVPKIVYVSCDPATQARDIAVLTEKGYRAEKVQGVEMFPWTEHVETVVLLSRQ